MKIAGLDVGAVGHKESRDLHVPPISGHVKRCPPQQVSHGNLAPILLEQPAGLCGVAVERGLQDRDELRHLYAFSRPERRNKATSTEAIKRPRSAP